MVARYNDVYRPLDSLSEDLLEDDDDCLSSKPVVLLVEFKDCQDEITNRRRERRHAGFSFQRLEVTGQLHQTVF